MIGGRARFRARGTPLVSFACFFCQMSETPRDTGAKRFKAATWMADWTSFDEELAAVVAARHPAALSVPHVASRLSRARTHIPSSVRGVLRFSVADGAAVSECVLETRAPII